jgi:hypothetical protein
MRRWLQQSLRAAAYLYPAAWRRRYALEFDALLDEIDTGWKDIFDILKGALAMQLTFWKFKSILIAFSLVGLTIATAVAFSIPNRYRSTSILDVNTVAAPEAVYYVRQAWQDLSREAFLQGVAKRNGLFQGQPIAEVVQGMRSRISVRVTSIRGAESRHHLVLALDDTLSDPRVAQAVNRELLTALTAALPRAGGLASLEVLDSPSKPMQPIYPRRAAFALAGLLAGLLIGLTVAYALRWRIAIVRRPAY